MVTSAGFASVDFDSDNSQMKGKMFVSLDYPQRTKAYGLRSLEHKARPGR